MNTPEIPQHPDPAVAPRPILASPKDFRQLTNDELAAMDLKNALGKHIENWIENINNPEFGADLDQRWYALARTHFQEGLMALGRAIAKPNFF